MHVLFIHPNFPAQFGHIANYLTVVRKWKCTFLTSIDTTHLQLPFDHINYKVNPNEPQPKTFYNPDNLHTLFDHMAAIYKGLRGLRNFKPDLVVGHMSYGTMLYLRNLYDCPFVGYYELLPPPFWGDGLVLRKEFPPTEGVRLFNATYHTLTYLHLHHCDAGYTPTRYQLATAPKELRYKLRVIFDGTDCNLFQPRAQAGTVQFRGLAIGPETKVVTYVSRGLESARGFDIFMQVAKRISQRVRDVIFLIAGDERSNYGHEAHHIGNQTFKQYVLSRDSYDLSKFHFLGLIPTAELAALYNLSNLHIYLTVPYVLSWSMVQAMASGCPILGSATAPVQEAIDDGTHGLLGDFSDADGLADRAVRLLNDPDLARELGGNARQRALERYELGKCIAELTDYFQGFAEKTAAGYQVSL
jgi:glycosyltransferase involved in cell wall biosynthesis